MMSEEPIFLEDQEEARGVRRFIDAIHLPLLSRHLRRGAGYIRLSAESVGKLSGVEFHHISQCPPLGFRRLPRGFQDAACPVQPFRFDVKNGSPGASVAMAGNDAGTGRRNISLLRKPRLRGWRCGGALRRRYGQNRKKSENQMWRPSHVPGYLSAKLVWERLRLGRLNRSQARAGQSRSSHCSPRGFHVSYRFPEWLFPCAGEGHGADDGSRLSVRRWRL